MSTGIPSRWPDLPLSGSAHICMSYYNAAAAWPCWGRGDRQRGRAQGSGTRRPSTALPAALRAEAWAEGCSLTEAGFVLAFDQLLLPRDVGGPSLAPLMACHGQRSHMGGAARYWGRAPGAALWPAGPPLPGWALGLSVLLPLVQKRRLCRPVCWVATRPQRSARSPG